MYLINSLKKLNEDKYILISFFIIAFIIRLIVFVQTGDHNADGMYRRILTINWLKEPFFITGGYWPPLHLYLMAFLTALLKNTQISTRLVSLLFGTFIIFPYYYLVKLLFDRKLAIVSTLILVFYSLHIQYSTLSMSEVPFLFFLFSSLYFFYIFKTSEKNRLFFLIISGIFLNFASMIRFEAWIFIPLLAIFILIGVNNEQKIFSLKNKIIVYFFVFFFISLIFPLLWMIGNYQLYDDFLYSQNYSDHWIRTSLTLYPDPQLNRSIIYKILLWPAILSQTFWPLSFGSLKSSINIITILAGLGLAVSLLKKKNLEFLTIFIIIMLLFTYKLLNFTMLTQNRHILLPSLFLIPYITIGLEYALKFLNKNYVKIITIAILLSFITVSSYSVIAKNAFITPDYVFDVSNWLKENVKPGERVLLDEYNWWGLHILFYSGFNTTFTEDYDKNFEFVTDQIRIVRGGGKQINDSTVISYLEDYKPLYLVYSPKGKLTKILNFSSDCKNEVKFNQSFECKYATRNYNIYSLT